MYDGTLQTGCLIWLVVDLPIWKIWVRQFCQDYLQYIMENKLAMLETTNRYPLVI